MLSNIHNSGYCIIRLPDTDLYHLYTYSENKKAETIVKFTSFSTENTLSFNILEGIYNSLDFTKGLPIYLNSNKNSSLKKEKYLTKLNSCINHLNKSDLEKVVFSRKKVIQKKIDVFSSFNILCEQNPISCCYLLVTPQTTWMGATPESLFSIKENVLKTMALAGTLPLNKNWSEKEIEEQKIVSVDLENKLQTFSKNIKLEKTKEKILTNIKHLETKISAKLPINYSIEKIHSELHPTPAVCGTPTQKAKEYILENEDYNREFYTGTFSIEHENSFSCFVNLRCAKIFSNSVEIFVGGGILPNSSAIKEWEETELKSECIINSLQ